MDHNNKIRVSASEAVDLLVPTFKAALTDLETKHGPLTRDPVRALAILTAELGEVAKDVLGVTGSSRPSTEDKLAGELVQVVAVATCMLLNLLGDRVPADDAIRTLPEAGGKH